jgi:hypothetical protein
MMGTARIAGHSITVSGPFGNDGLPDDLDRLPAPVQAAFRLHPVWPDLAARFWRSYSTEQLAPEMRSWARAEFKL